MLVRLSGKLCGILAFALVLTCATPSFGQSGGGEITGLVTDPTGAAVPGAAIVITEVAKNLKTLLQTNSQGSYYMRLEPGEYAVEATFTGFKTYRVTNLRVAVAQVLRHDITLELGDVVETVEVVAAAGAVSLQTDTVEIGIDVPSQVVQGLPTVTRKTWEFIDLSPTVRFSTSLSGRGFNLSGYQPFVAAAGNPGGRGHNWYIDGSNSYYTRIQGDHGNMPVINPPPESVAELRLIVGNYGAEFGEGAGLTIIVTTKSGTNEFHGNLYNYMQNRSFNARNTFLPERPPHNYNQFGGSIGGPIIRDRTFFFVNLEGQLEKVAGPRLLNVPTQAMKRGDFSQSFNAAGNVIPIYDPMTTRTEGGALVRDQFPGNIIPANRMDRVAQNLLPFWPEPNAPGTITGANNLLGTGVFNDLHRDFQSIRIDHAFNDRHRGFGRFMDDFTDPGVQGPLSDHACCTSSDQLKRLYWSKSRVVQGGLTSVFSPTLISEFRLWFDRFQFLSEAGLTEDFNTDWPGRLGLKNLDIGVFPIFNITGIEQIGAGGFAQNYAGEYWIAGPSLTLTFIHGKHNTKVGGVYKYSSAQNLLRLTPSGRFNFRPQHTALPNVANTGLGFASFLLGQINDGEEVERIPNHRKSFHTSLFIQDDWRIRDNLTLNLGFRYEYDTPAYDALETSSFLFAADGRRDIARINPVSGTPGVITFARDIWAQTHDHVLLHEDNPWGVAPRFGFAWSPREDLVIRGGYGWYLPGQDLGNLVWNGPFHGGEIVNFRPQSDPLGLTSAQDAGGIPFVLQDAMPVAPTPVFDDSFGSVGGGQIPVFNPEIYINPRPLIYSQQFNLSVQKRMTNNTYVALTYMANLVRHLPMDWNGHNEIPPAALAELQALAPSLTAEQFQREAQLRRPFPQFGNVSSRGLSHATSNFHAGIIQFTRNFSNGLAFTSHYTWSKMLTAQGYTRSFYDLASNYTYSNNDVRHRFIWAGTYELPFGPGKPFLGTGAAGKIFGDWALTGRWEWTSGRPLRWGNAFNTTNAFPRGTQGVNLTGKPAVTGRDNPGSSDWFDTSVVRQPDPYTFGSAAIHVFGPGYNNVDLSLIKKIRLTERWALDLRGDFFDIFNHVNYNNPGTTLNTPNFGQIGSTVSPGGNRIIQLSFKVHF